MLQQLRVGTETQYNFEIDSVLSNERIVFVLPAHARLDYHIVVHFYDHVLIFIIVHDR